MLLASIVSVSMASGLRNTRVVESSGYFSGSKAFNWAVAQLRVMLFPLRATVYAIPGKTFQYWFTVHMNYCSSLTLVGTCSSLTLVGMRYFLIHGTLESKSWILFAYA